MGFVTDIDVGAVIFDMDGLLLDTEALARRTWGEAAADCGVDLDDALFASLIGRTRRESGAMLEEAFGSSFSLELFRMRCGERWTACIVETGIPVKTGAMELLDTLDAAGLPRAVATSTSREGARRSLETAGILERFDHVVTGDMVERGKPAPDIFLLAAERLGVEPERCVVLEDSHYGVMAAHAAGMSPIMVPDLLAPTEEIERLAVAVVTSLHDVRDALAEALDVSVMGSER
jgi:HAD superfamily hydrolase (TIGR01509 family)